MIHSVPSQRAHHEALHSIELELEEAEPRLVELQERVMNLRRAAASLRSLLNLAPQETRRLAAYHATSETRGTDVEPSSTDRVVQILIEMADETTREEIAHEFAVRGWNAEWKEPEAALRMAIRRATEREGVIAVRPGTYVFLPALDSTTRDFVQRRLRERSTGDQAEAESRRLNNRQSAPSRSAETTLRSGGDRGEAGQRE